MERRFHPHHCSMTPYGGKKMGMGEGCFKNGIVNGTLTLWETHLQQYSDHKMSRIEDGKWGVSEERDS